MEPAKPAQPVKTVPIKMDTEHELLQVPKRIFICYEIGRRLVLLGVGVWITRVLFLYCLFNPATNPIVTTFFCVISLACFLGVGLPADKLAKLPFSS